MQSARQEILNKLKQATHKTPVKPDFEDPVYHEINESLDFVFKENLEKVNGSVYLCNSEQEVFKKLEIHLKDYNKNQVVCKEEDIKNQLSKHNIAYSQVEELPESVEVGITTCEYLIAHTGSVMVCSAQKGGRQMFIYPSIHIVISNKSQLVDYLNAAYSGIQKKYGKSLPSQITLITGPSRTADIEKTLVMGAHGPRELHVYIY